MTVNIPQKLSHWFCTLMMMMGTVFHMTFIYSQFAKQQRPQIIQCCKPVCLPAVVMEFLPEVVNCHNAYFLLRQNFIVYQLV